LSLPVVETFAGDPDADYVLDIVATNVKRSDVILLNGVIVHIPKASPGEVTVHVRTPVRLHDRNWILVWLFGRPPGSLTITILGGVKTIGAEGGTIAAPEGRAALIIPAGALPVETEISVAPATIAPPVGVLDGDVMPLGPSFSLEPRGLAFERQVTMTVDYTGLLGQVSSADEIVVFHFDEAGTFVDVATAVDDPAAGTLSFTLDHFSSIAFGRKAGGFALYGLRWNVPVVRVSRELALFNDWAEHTSGITFTSASASDAHIVVHPLAPEFGLCPPGSVELIDLLVKTCLPGLTRVLGDGDQVHIWPRTAPGNNPPIREPNETSMRHAIGHALGIAHPSRLPADGQVPVMAPIRQFGCDNPFVCQPFEEWHLFSRSGLHGQDVAAIQAKYGPPFPPPPTLLAPPSGALIPQNDASNGCALLAGRERAGYGYRISFDWTNVAGASQYRLVAKHQSAAFPIVNVTIPQSAYVHVSCNAFALEPNLTGWSWQVQAFNGVWGSFSAPRPFAFLACLLPDGAACTTAPGPYPRPDLSIEMTDAPDPGISSGILTYTITVRNVGSAPAADVALVDALPASLVAPVCNVSQGICTIAAGEVMASLGTLAAGAQANVAISSLLPAVGTRAFVTNTASVTTTTVETSVANNAGTRTTTVNPPVVMQPAGGPSGAVVPVVVVDPHSDDTVYVGTSSGGVFKSTDAGATWHPANAGLGASGINALVVHPENPGVLYAGTLAGMAKTIDGGMTWAMHPALTSNVQTLAFDRLDSQTLYAGTQGGGVLKSTDGGATWAASNTGLTSLDAAALSTDVSGAVYFATDAAGVFKSVNGGASWMAVNTGLLNLQIRAMATHPANASVLLVGTRSGLFRSADGGGSWTGTGPAVPNPDTGAVAIDAAEPSRMFLGTTAGIFRSVDDGMTWTAMSSGLRWVPCCVSGPLAIAVDRKHSGVAYVGTNGGVFKTVNAGVSWNQATDGLNASNVTNVAVDPTNPSILHASTGTRSALYRSSDGGAHWVLSDVRALIGTDVVVDPLNPNIVYAATGGTTSRTVYRSVDGGATWADTVVGSGSVVTALAIDPVAPATLYAATPDQGVFKTIDSGDTWFAASAGLTQSNVQALAIDPLNATIVYAGTLGGGVFKSTDAAGSWVAVNTGLGDLRVVSLVVDPASTTTVYAATGAGVFKSTDGASNWSASNAGIPVPFNVQALAVDPIDRNVVYLGRFGAQKLFKSTDGGLTWVNSSAGLPDLPMAVRSITIDPSAPDTVYVGINGGGVFKTTDGGLTWLPTGVE
jgi:photosystem II stability/assembly factor-like uncharacterized protein